MKATFAKVLGLTLVLALVLSGCNLIEVDAKMQADEEIAVIDKNYSAVAATYDGGEITVAEAVGDFNASYSEVYYMYSYFGLTMGHEQEHEIVEETLAQHVRAEIAAARYDAEHSLSEEELNELAANAQEEYEQNLEYAKESVEGDSDNQRAENARVMLRASGMDYDSLYENAVLNAKYAAMEELLRDEIAELTDEELQAAFDEKVAEQQETYADGSSFESAMSNGEEIVCWVPDGYRTVKHILVKPSDEVMDAYTSAVTAQNAAQANLDSLNEELEAGDGERTAEEIQADIDAAKAELADCESTVADAAQACLDDVKDVTDEIYSRLEDGESFEDLIAEYGEDPGMQREPTMTSGYYVSSESVAWEVNFRDAAMALDQVGDYTAEPVVSGSGVHIIQYTADVAGGEVALDEVRDALYEEALEEAKETHVTDTIDAWVEAANPTYDVDAFESAVSGS